MIRGWLASILGLTALGCAVVAIVVVVIGAVAWPGSDIIERMIGVMLIMFLVGVAVVCGFAAFLFSRWR